ncbi:TIGR04219 family outer membrane beta-barrel protein [uncultured Paraglaciecola sp.]|uniref:TIGR04219 family outer membrane beta-barrel protein n=1 Tax=uncultured Paraglaciecola sp. TaxID=1765024 RepID=UPI0025D09A5B|nr:TIGR04219 family outer membrane beta-barrel protein [uncultured Paraglaciecola sp.]
MKKTALSIGMIVLGVSFTSQADTLLGLYAGAQGWNMQTSGGFSSDGTNANFNFEDKANSNLYVAFEHPLPLIPNIKVQRTIMNTMGETTLNSQYSFGDEIYAANTDLNTDVQLTATDFILYYELFDNDLISFDVGVNAKYIDGDLMVTEKEDSSSFSREEFSGPVPMVYSRLAIGIPFSGFGAFVEGSFLNIDDHTLSDYQAALTYSLMENLAVDVTFQVGYRAVELELDDLDDIYSNLEFKGVYAGLEVHF